MPTFFLSYPSDREQPMLGRSLPESRCDSIEAPDWLHAKQALGFELTPLQQQMLPLDEIGRMNAQLVDANYGRNLTPWSKST
jgi:hypothetical protein